MYHPHESIYTSPFHHKLYEITSVNKVSVPKAVPKPLGTEVCPQGCPQAKKCVPANCPRTFQLSPSFPVCCPQTSCPQACPRKKFYCPRKTIFFKTCPRKINLLSPRKNIDKKTYDYILHNASV